MRQSKEYSDFCTFVYYKNRKDLTSFPDELIKFNPKYFESYNIAGDVYIMFDARKAACERWKQALECKIPKLAQRKAIEDKIKKYQ